MVSAPPKPEYQEAIAQLKTQMEEWAAAQVSPLQEEINRLTTQLETALADDRETRRAALARASHRDEGRVLSGPYAGMDRVDASLAVAFWRGQMQAPQGYSLPQLTHWYENAKAALDSTSAGTGAEVIDEAVSAEIWRDVHLQTAVASLMRHIDMPVNEFPIPIDLGDITWYATAENTDVTSSDPATRRVTLSAKELAGKVEWSYTLDEDAVIAMMPELRALLTRQTAEVIDDVLLNADTSGNGNINNDGAATASGTYYRLGWDGLIHAALVDNNRNGSTNANAALTTARLNALRGTLGKYGVRPSEVAMITDVATYITAIGLAELQTVDKFGPQATIHTGQVGAIGGIPLIVSEQMKLADADGKVTGAGNTTNTGRVLMFNHTQARVGFRRQLLIETDRDISKRQNVMVASFRIAHALSQARGSQQVVRLLYNITGV